MSPARRTVVLGLAALGSCVGEAQASAIGLDAAARERGRRFGSAVRIADLQREQDLRRVVLDDCSRLTPEVELKWNAVEPERGRLVLQPIDDLAAFAASKGMQVRGHTLVWRKSIPGWASEALVDTRDWRLVARYFASVMPRYGDVIDQWDVINEPLEPGVRADGLGPSAYLDAFGPDYIPRALVQARSYAPQAVLMINEYGLEYDDADGRARRVHMLRLLEGLKRSGAPLDGLGLQSHLDLRRGRVNRPSLRRFCTEVAGLGLSLQVTELDVKEAAYADPATRRDTLVADEVRRYLDTVLQEPAVTAVATWGMSTRHSWLQVEPQDWARFKGAWRDGDGPGLNRGLPYDAAMQPVAMYAAIQAALQGGAPAAA